MDEREQKEAVRERFTNTAQVFSNYAVARRAELAEWLARAVRAASADRAVDLACGPGTLALRFARHVRRICGVDLTPAMLELARKSATEEGLRNLDFVIGDAHQLPFPDASLDLVVNSFSLHHMPDPARVLREVSRIVKRGGRIGIVDVRAPEDSQAAELANKIEQVRDNSHTRSLPQSEFEKLFAANGLRTVVVEPREESRDFDSWMYVAGSKPGDETYRETRRLIEATLENDAAGFHPQVVPAASNTGEDARPALHIVHSTLVIAAEKV